MYYTEKPGEPHFIYFWCSKTKAINNDKPDRKFEKPFVVTPENCIGWRKSSRPNMIAPELLTYWEI